MTSRVEYEVIGVLKDLMPTNMETQRGVKYYQTTDSMNTTEEQLLLQIAERLEYHGLLKHK